jgi:hypothetical protein
MTFPLLLALTLSTQAPAQPQPPATAPAGSAPTATAPAPALSPAERAVKETAARVFALRAELKKPGLSAAQKSKLKKQLVHAEARAREARDAAYGKQLQAEQQAYVDKMMPIWQKQAELNAQFSIEAAKARAFQQMAETAEKQRQQDLWIQWQRNQIFQQMAR